MCFFWKQTNQPTQSSLFLKSNLQLECFFLFLFFLGHALVPILLEIFLVSCLPLLQRRQERSGGAAPAIPIPHMKDGVPSQAHKSHPLNQESPCHSRGHECSLRACQTVPTTAKTTRSRSSPETKCTSGQHTSSCIPLPEQQTWHEPGFENKTCRLRNRTKFIILHMIETAAAPSKIMLNWLNFYLDDEPKKIAVM